MESLLKIGERLQGEEEREMERQLRGEGADPKQDDVSGADADVDPAILQQLLKAAGAVGSIPSGADGEGPISQEVIPTPGCCIKTDAKDTGKVFVNVCWSDLIPSPPDISDEQLAMAVATQDPRAYQVPMAVGEPHAEIDKSKNGCTAYDIIISKDAFYQFEARPGIKEFLIELMFASIEAKNDGTLLNREYTILEKRKKMGKIKPQHIRAKPKKIKDISRSVAGGLPSSTGSIQEMEVEPEVPKYTLLREPEIGVPEFYIVEIELPSQKSAKTMQLDVGDKRFELSVHPRKYFLGLDLEHPIDHNNTGAQFDKKTKKLTVTMEVATNPEQPN